MRRAARKDSTHQDVRDAFEAAGWSVLDLSRVGGGVPDLLVSRQSRAILVEVKAPKGKLRASQTGWQDGWRGIPVVVCRSTEDVAKIVSNR